MHLAFLEQMTTLGKRGKKYKRKAVFVRKYVQGKKIDTKMHIASLLL